MVKYNKLIRDNIIQIIESKAKQAKFRIANDDEYLLYLILKLKEEMIEFEEENSIEELADIIEVIEALKKTPKYSNVEKVRKEKKIKNGAFDKKIILEEII